MTEYNRDAELLRRIVKYCDRIQHAKDRFGNSYGAFRDDIEYQDACTMSILQIGEIVGRLSEAFKSTNNDIPWQSIISMRNLFAHEYEHTDVKIVWETLRDDIVPLRESCNRKALELEPDHGANDYDDDLLTDDDEWEPEM